MAQPTPSCKVYNTWEVFKYNMLFWNILFMFGLNFTHLDQGPLKHFTLDPQDWKTWGRGLWMFFIFLVLLIGSIVYLEVRTYIEVGVLR